MRIFVDYNTTQLRNLVSMGNEVLEVTRKLLADTQKDRSNPFWKEERKRWTKDIKKITEENKAYVAELRRRGERP